MLSQALQIPTSANPLSSGEACLAPLSDETLNQ